MATKDPFTKNNVRMRPLLLALWSVLTYLLMELSPSGGAANSAATQENPSIL
jgi:hypothetical protein